MPSFHSGEVVSRRARVQSQVERSEPEGNLDGFLVRLHDSQKNEGMERRGSGGAGSFRGDLRDASYLLESKVVEARDSVPAMLGEETKNVIRPHRTAQVSKAMAFFR